jgi:hypothetical protein
MACSPSIACRHDWRQRPGNNVLRVSAGALESNYGIAIDSHGI